MTMGDGQQNLINKIMKEIWMGASLGLLSQINPQLAQEILNKGTVKELEDSGVKYIVIEE